MTSRAPSVAFVVLGVGVVLVAGAAVALTFPALMWLAAEADWPWALRFVLPVTLAAVVVLGLVVHAHDRGVLGRAWLVLSVLAGLVQAAGCIAWGLHNHSGTTPPLALLTATYGVPAVSGLALASLFTRPRRHNDGEAL